MESRRHGAIVMLWPIYRLCRRLIQLYVQRATLSIADGERNMKKMKEMDQRGGEMGSSACSPLLLPSPAGLPLCYRGGLFEGDDRQTMNPKALRIWLIRSVATDITICCSSKKL